MKPASERIASFLDDAVAGLADDPELRLDVRAELAAHIDEAVERHRADGKTENEAVDLVLRSLGSPLDVAGDLQSANRGRMRMRGLARLALRGLVVPAAVIVGLLSATRPVLEARSTAQLLDSVSGVASISDWLPGLDLYGSRLDEEQRLIVYGDPKAIWERYPDDPVYFGNYLSRYGHDPAMDLQEMLRQGASLEPDNARFGYIRAAALLDDAASITNIAVDAEREGEPQYALVIHDREDIDRAMTEYVLAAQKPWMKNYSREMLMRRFELLPEPKRYVDLIHRTGIAAAVLLPDISRIRTLGRIAALYAEQLAKEGKTHAAEPVLTAWYPMLRHLEENSFTLIEVLILKAVAKEAGKTEVRAREEAGQTALADRARARMAAFVQPVEAWEYRRKNPDPGLQPLDELVETRAGILAALLLPAEADGVIQPEELDANRWTEYVLMERLSLAALSGFLLLILLVLAVVAIASRFLSAGRSIPILMVPPWPRMLKIIGIGVVVPLVLYAVYSRRIPLAGRAYSIEYVNLKLFSELFLLGITIVLVTWISARNYVRDRCSTYGLPVPRQSEAMRWLPPAFLGLTWIVLLTAPVGPGAWTVPQVVAAGLTGAVIVASFLAGVVFLAVGLWGRKSHRLYYGTMARSLIPVLAAAILVIGCGGMPYLSAAEARLVRQDRLFGLAADTGGFSAPEKQLTEDLLGQIRTNLAARDEQELRN